MTQQPDEPAEQWLTRADAEYRAAQLGVQRQLARLRSQDRTIPPQVYPLLDEEYDWAMDALDAADAERSDAAAAVVHETTAVSESS